MIQFTHSAAWPQLKENMSFTVPSRFSHDFKIVFFGSLIEKKSRSNREAKKLAPVCVRRTGRRKKQISERN
jgi:hypothetical protein